MPPRAALENESGEGEREEEEKTEKGRERLGRDGAGTAWMMMARLRRGRDVDIRSGSEDTSCDWPDAPRGSGMRWASGNSPRIK